MMTSTLCVMKVEYLCSSSVGKFSRYEKKSVCVVVASSIERERERDFLSKVSQKVVVVVSSCTTPSRRRLFILVREKRERERGKDDDEGF